MAKLCNRPQGAYPVPAMSSRPAPSTYRLRLIALVLLALGMLAKPILVASCELDDLAAPADGIALVDAGGGLADDGCCPGQACGECCTAVAAMPTAATAASAVAPQGRPERREATSAYPAPLAVAIRPPIVA